MKKERVFSEGSLHVQRSIFKRAFSGVAFRLSNLGLFGSFFRPGAREKRGKIPLLIINISQVNFNRQ